MRRFGTRCASPSPSQPLFPHLPLHIQYFPRSSFDPPEANSKGSEDVIAHLMAFLNPSPPTPSHSPLPLAHHPHPPTPLCLSLTTHTLPLPSASPSPPTPSHSPLPLPHHPHPPTPLCLSLTTHTLPLPSASPSPPSVFNSKLDKIGKMEECGRECEEKRRKNEEEKRQNGDGEKEEDTEGRNTSEHDGVQKEDGTLTQLPTMSSVLRQQVNLTTPSCLTFFEIDESIWSFLDEINEIQREWNTTRGEGRQIWKIVLQMLRMEGMEDVTEGKMLSDSKGYFGRDIVSKSIMEQSAGHEPSRASIETDKNQRGLEPN
ncbi:hypothetical protein BLNAU_5136 [Blattamonas nauphoetae]|uniref:Uncharacterized protein n=1 Tax=Blattamonas nauphoetae TaxID=2049346 RepID=A0ABQ9Y8C1_9EUKA|nr:hypothetical protein BLNAU_5136 [Blattamonas nauphoetae]